MEQFATTDQGHLLATDISAGDQVSSFPSVIWLIDSKTVSTRNATSSVFFLLSAPATVA